MKVWECETVCGCVCVCVCVRVRWARKVKKMEAAEVGEAAGCSAAGETRGRTERAELGGGVMIQKKVQKSERLPLLKKEGAGRLSLTDGPVLHVSSTKW